MKKIIYLDLETTGLSPETHGIIQIGGEIEIGGETKEKFNFLVKPFKGQLISKEALEINKRTMAEIAAFEEPESIFRRFKNLLEKYIMPYDKSDKFFMVGYNCHSFDSQFLREFFVRNNSKYYGSYFWNPSIDVMLLAVAKLAHKRYEMENLKLMTVARHLGIEVDEEKLHDAEYDIFLTKAIFKEVVK